MTRQFRELVFPWLRSHSWREYAISGPLLIHRKRHVTISHSYRTRKWGREDLNFGWPECRRCVVSSTLSWPLCASRQSVGEADWVIAQTPSRATPPVQLARRSSSLLSACLLSWIILMFPVKSDCKLTKFTWSLPKNHFYPCWKDSLFTTPVGV